MSEDSGRLVDGGSKQGTEVDEDSAELPAKRLSSAGVGACVAMVTLALGVHVAMVLQRR